MFTYILPIKINLNQVVHIPFVPWMVWFLATKAAHRVRRFAHLQGLFETTLGLGLSRGAVSIMKFQGITRWAQKTTYKWGLWRGPTAQMHGYLRKKRGIYSIFRIPEWCSKNIFFDVFQQPRWKQKPTSWPHTRVDTKEIKIRALCPRKRRILISHSHEHPSTPHIYVLPGHVPFEKNYVFFVVSCSD